MKKKRKESLLLAIDIGNTSISYGLFKSGRLWRYWYGNYDVIPQIGRFVASSGLSRNMNKVVISSVNPKRLSIFIKRLKEIPIFGCFPVKKGDVLIIGKSLKPKICHKYSNINKLGSDRLVNIYGAMRWYKKPVLFMNFGTASTFDLISKKGVYEGGLIVPGIETSWNALQEKAALLPKIRKIVGRKPFIGRDTRSCMLSGLLQGFGAMVDGLIDRFKRFYGRDLCLVAGGGLAGLIRPYVRSRIRIDQQHALKSLALIYRDSILKGSN